jgi:hypothetical protein
LKIDLASVLAAQSHGGRIPGVPLRFTQGFYEAEFVKPRREKDFLFISG